MKHVGRQIDAAARWQEVGTLYAADIDSVYHRHRLQVIRALLPPLGGKSVVDFGCGEGVLVREAKRQGAQTVVGVDIDATLLGKAKESGATLLLGSSERLAEIDSADCLIAANIAAYLTDEQDAEFYQHAARILRPGGHLVITHSNELFDLYTLNAYTRTFYQKHFNVDPTALLKHPDRPSRSSFNIRENPLAYPDKLAAHGFAIERTEFIHRHTAPPLLTNDDPDDMDRERPDTLNVTAADRWKLMFQCSMFGVRARITPSA